MQKLFRLLVIWGTLLVLLVACAPSLGSSSLPAKTSATTPIPPEYAAELPSGLKEEIEEATQYDNWWIPGSYQALRHLGTYHGYTVISLGSTPELFCPPLTIGEDIFYRTPSHSLLGYRNGKLFFLEELYESGELNQTDISRCALIHLWYGQQDLQYKTEQTLQASLEVPVIWFDRDIRYGLRLYETATDNGYYGYFVFVPDDIDGNTTYELCGHTFQSAYPFKLFFCSNNILMSAEEAQTKGYFSTENISLALEIHNLYEEMYRQLTEDRT